MCACRSHCLKQCLSLQAYSMIMKSADENANKSRVNEDHCVSLTYRLTHNDSLLAVVWPTTAGAPSAEAHISACVILGDEKQHRT